MSRPIERYSTTPFARVLTAYMWSKIPPWNAPKLAAVLGVQRNRVNNWIFHDIVPEIDTMLPVLAKLGIPISKLLEAYAADGLPVPPLTEAEAATRAAIAPAPTLPPAPAANVTIPPARRGRGGGVGHRAGQPPQAAPQAAPQREEWENMLAHTREVMTLAGMPAPALDALLAHLEQTRDGKPSEAQRRIAEEHQPTQATEGASGAHRAGEKGEEDDTRQSDSHPRPHRPKTHPTV